MVTERLVSGGVSGFKVVLAPDAGSWVIAGPQKLSYYDIRVKKKISRHRVALLMPPPARFWLSQSSFQSFW